MHPEHPAHDHAYVVAALRTPFGRCGGALSSVRTDELGAIPIRALTARHPGIEQGMAVVLERMK